MLIEKVSFKNADGNELSAILNLPVNKNPAAYVIFAHCFTCGKNLKAAVNIAKALCSKELAVLRFDFTGLGESEGEFAETNFTSNVEDLISAAEFLEKKFKAPKILIGHSLGGTAVLQAASKIPSSVAVATIGSPCSPIHVKKNLGNNIEVIQRKGEAIVDIAGRKFRIKKQFLKDLNTSNMDKHIENLKRAILIFHSPADKIVSIDNAAHIFEKARHPKSFVSLDKADHLLSKEEDSCYAGVVTAEWARKYLSEHSKEEKQKLQPVNAVMVRTGKTYETDIMIRHHSLTADEPVSYGGTDKGPDPYGLFSAALGSCTSITLRMYADRKKWDLQEVIVKLNHKKIHAKDCKKCETKVGKIDSIFREIEVKGNLSNEQKNRLLEIAELCPVHKTLHSEIEIETSLKEEAESS